MGRYEEDVQARAHNYKALVKLALIGAGVLALIITGVLSVDITRVGGHELGIKETWSGIETNVYQPKTYVLGPGSTMITYDAASRVFEMRDYLVQSSEGQDMRISMNLRWRIDPAKLVEIHRTVRHDIEQKLIRPVVMRVVKDEATTKRATDAYSGAGLVELQSAIQHALAGAGEGKELLERGIFVENFVIEHIELDPKYIDEIKLKQIATQKQQRAVEEQKAAEADALVAKAQAQANYNKTVVEAERDAKVTVTAARAENEKAIIAAEAEQKKLVLEAEGKRQAMIAIAEGTLAQGKAEAAAKEALLRAWAVPGADAFVKVEVSRNLGAAFANIKGYLPSDMKVNLLTSDFVKAVDTMTGSPVVTTPAK